MRWSRGLAPPAFVWGGVELQVPSATPDFLLGLVALANFMRLSLRKAARVGAGEGRVAGNPGAFQSG